MKWNCFPCGVDFIRWFGPHTPTHKYFYLFFFLLLCACVWMSFYHLWPCLNWNNPIQTVHSRFVCFVYLLFCSLYTINYKKIHSVYPLDDIGFCVSQRSIYPWYYLFFRQWFGKCFIIFALLKEWRERIGDGFIYSSSRSGGSKQQWAAEKKGATVNLKTNEKKNQNRANQLGIRYLFLRLCHFSFVMPCIICYFHTITLDMKLNVRLSEQTIDRERLGQRKNERMRKQKLKANQYDYNYSKHM